MPHGQPHTPPGLLSDTPLNNPDYDYTTILPFRIRNVLDVDELDTDVMPEIAFPGLVRDVGNAAIRMGQTVRGLRNPNPADMFFDTMEFAPAGLLAGRSAPKGATFGVFAGPQAETANKGMLAIAEDMAAKGASRDDIWNKTGWFQDVDGKWKFEIDDSKSRLDFGEGLEEIDYGQVEGAAQDVFDFPGLFNLGRGAYPEMSDIRVRAEYEPTLAQEGSHGRISQLSDLFDDLPDDLDLPKMPSIFQRRLMNAEARQQELERIAKDEVVTKDWDEVDWKLHEREIAELREEVATVREFLDRLPEGSAIAAYGADPEVARSAVLHELQHAIQRREGFGYGGNPRISYDRAEADLQRKMLENFDGSHIRFAEAVKEKRLAAEEYRQLADVDYVRRMRNITRPNQIFNQSAYYEFSDELRRKLGPIPKRHVDGGRALKKWIADAGEWFASRTPRNAYFDIYAGKDPKELKNALRRAKYRLDKVNTPSLRAAEEAGRQLDILVEAKAIGEFDPFDAYRRLSGEVEARNVQTRMNMTPEERRANPPYRTRDVDEDDIIMSAPGTPPMGLVPTDQNKQPMRPGGIGLFGLYDGGVI